MRLDSRITSPAFLIGLIVLWSPPVVALIGGSVANALVILTPLAIAASFVWVIFVGKLTEVNVFGELSPGLRMAVVTAVLLMAAGAVIAAAIGLEWRTPFVIALLWTIIVVLSPLSVWYYNLLTRARAKEEQGR
jgi:hypothetical protein